MRGSARIADIRDRPPWLKVLEDELRKLEAVGLKRHLRQWESAQGSTGTLEGHEVINLASNDYLGLANEEFMREAFRAAAHRFGVGSGASRLLAGSQPPHQQLEEALADFKRTEAALAFACGFSAAVGTISALTGPGDVLVLDKLSHACLVDGAKLSGATLRIFPHNDLEKLDSHLRWAAKKFPRGRILILTESVFSMDGDLAPLAEIVEIKDRYGAWLMVDEAHGIGVIGSEGRGLVDALGLGPRVEIQMGTLGKALGAAGGVIAGSRPLVDLLVNKARSFIFSTAPPAAQAAAAHAAITWLPTPAGKARIASLEKNRRLLSELCRLPQPPPSAIVPVMVGSECAAVELAARCLESGFWIPAVRYPTVPRGKARLRLSLTAKHTTQHLEHASAMLLAMASMDAPQSLNSEI